MNIKNILIGFITQIRSIFTIGMHIFSKRETQLYPEKSVYLSPRYRGRIILTRDPNGDERCVACNLCATVCPASCIALQKAERQNGRWYAKFFRINLSRCIFCGFCEEACPTRAIQLTPDFELGEFKRQDLIYEKEDLLISGPGKYPEYDYYKIAGVRLKNNEEKNKINNNDETEFIDVKNLLP